MVWEFQHGRKVIKLSLISLLADLPFHSKFFCAWHQGKKGVRTGREIGEPSPLWVKINSSSRRNRGRERRAKHRHSSKTIPQNSVRENLQWGTREAQGQWGETQKWNKQKWISQRERIRRVEHTLRNTSALAANMWLKLVAKYLSFCRASSSGKDHAGHAWK